PPPNSPPFPYTPLFRSVNNTGNQDRSGRFLPFPNLLHGKLDIGRILGTDSVHFTMVPLPILTGHIAFLHTLIKEVRARVRVPNKDRKSTRLNSSHVKIS